MAGQPESARLTRDKVLLTYKYLTTPEEILVSNMMARSSAEDLKRHFRSISLALHPDKNDHPQAKDAFQTAIKSYNEATGQFPKP